MNTNDLALPQNKLKSMTLEELWLLFPINLVAHREEWHEWAVEEISALSSLLPNVNPVISHIGSTAIPGISAKPIIDILVEIPSEADRSIIQSIMETNGYICMSESGTRLSFNKGYTPEGYAERVFHIHFHHSGDNDELLFRDYLIAHPYIAEEYELLKVSLMRRYKNNRDAYTEAKTPFIRKILSIAKQHCLTAGS